MTPLSEEWGYLIVIALVFCIPIMCGFLCGLSLNCAFDVNRMGRFHLPRRWDGPPKTGVPLLVTQLLLMELQNSIFNAILSQRNMDMHFNEASTPTAIPNRSF